MNSCLLLTSALLFTCLAGVSGAQQTVFHEDFEDGLSGWDPQGLWNEESETDPCGLLVAPFPSPTKAAYYGGAGGNCSYAGELNPSGLITLDPISIPDAVSSVTLRVWSYEDAECPSCEWDWRYVFVKIAGGAWNQVGEGTQLQQWYEIVIDLTAYAGEDILLMFEFNPIDWENNDYFGWMIDDVRIEVEPCSSGTNYCLTSPNSVGSGAVLAGQGVPSISSNSFTLESEFAPPGQFGLFFYGPARIQIPFGDGYRCVGAGSIGTFRLNPAVLIDSMGHAERLLDFTAPPTGSGPGKIEPGSYWYFQFWYRDPAGGGSGFNLSDGLCVLFCP